MKKIIIIILFLFIPFLNYSQPCYVPSYEYNIYTLFNYYHDISGDQLEISFVINDDSNELSSNYYMDFGDGFVQEVFDYPIVYQTYDLSNATYVSNEYFSATVTMHISSPDGCRAYQETITIDISDIEVELNAVPSSNLALGASTDLSYKIITSKINLTNLTYDLYVKGSSYETGAVDLAYLNYDVPLITYTPSLAGIYSFQLHLKQDGRIIESSPLLDITVSGDGGTGTDTAPVGSCECLDRELCYELEYTVQSTHYYVKGKDCNSSEIRNVFAGCGQYKLWHSFYDERTYRFGSNQDYDLWGTNYPSNGINDWSFWVERPSAFETKPKYLPVYFQFRCKVPDNDHSYTYMNGGAMIKVEPMAINEIVNDYTISSSKDYRNFNTYLPEGVCYSTEFRNPNDPTDQLTWLDLDASGSNNIGMWISANIDDQPREVTIKIYPPAEYSEINTVIDGQQMNYRLITITQEPYLTYIDPNAANLIDLPDFSYPDNTVYFGLMPANQQPAIINFKNYGQLPYDVIEEAYNRTGERIMIRCFDENMNEIVGSSVIFDVHFSDCNSSLSIASITANYSDILSLLDENDMVFLRSQSYIDAQAISLNLGQSLIFTAKDEVRLMPPFEVAKGSYFHARIDNECESERTNQDNEVDVQKPEIITEPVQSDITENTEKTVITIGNMTDVLPQEEILVYPNPTDGLFTIELININDVESIEIFSPNGTKTKIITPVIENIIIVDLTSYSAGIYLLKFNRKNSIDYRKLIMR